MLDGVALGLSEATKVNVSVIRLLFFGLLFFDGVGLVLYLLLALFMPVHPDDRQFLLRFRLRRWLRRTAAAPDAR
jgi:phage shock protein PspC (stress-responsive transcriptional regulator)